MAENPKKVSDVKCPVRHFSDVEFAEFKKDPFAFYNLVYDMQKNEEKGMGFKITLETPLIHNSFDEMISSQDWVDEIDFIEYYEKDAPEGLLAAERRFFDDQDDIQAVSKYKEGQNEINDNIRKDDKRKGKFRVLHEMTKYKDPLNLEYVMAEPIKVDLTLLNIDKLATHLSKKVNFHKEITEDSLIDDVDELINAIRKSITLNVPNINLTPDLLSNADNPFNPWSLMTPMRKVPNNAKVAGVTSPYVYFSGQFSHSPHHIEDSSLASFNANFGPGANVWIMVNEKYLPRIIEALRNEFKGKFSSCPGFIRSKSYLLTCAWFRANGMPFKMTIQRAGDIIITPANCIHMVICLSRCFKIAVNFMDARWFSLNNDEYYICLGKHKSKSDKKPWSHGSMPRPKEDQFNSIELLSLWGSYVAEIKAKQPSGIVTTVERGNNMASSSSSSFTQINNNGDISDSSVDFSEIVCTPDVSHIVTGSSVQKRARKLCSVCSKSFCDNRRLNGHFLRVHTGYLLPESPTFNRLKTKICPECGKTYYDGSTLIKHIKNVHSPDAIPYKRRRSDALSDRFNCTLCKKNYASKQTLQRHVDKIHQ